MGRTILIILLILFENIQISAKEKDDIEEFYNQAWGLVYTNPNGAIIKAKELEDLSEKHNDLQGLIKSHYLQGTANYEINKYDLAVHHFSTGLNLLGKKNSKKDLRTRLFLLQSLGNAYDQVQNIQSSMYYYEKAFKIAKDLKNEQSIAELTYNISLSYYKSGEIKQARDLFRIALKYFKDEEQTQYVAKCLNSIGNSYNQEGKYDLALSYYNDAISMIQNSPHHIGDLALYKSNLGENAKKRGDFETAETLYANAIDICNRHKLSKEGARIQANIGDLKMLVGDTVSANNHYTNAILLCDTSVYNTVLDRCVLSLVQNNISRGEKDDLMFNSSIMAGQYSKLSELVHYLKIKHEQNKVNIAALEFQQKQNRAFIDRLTANLTVFQVLLILSIVALLIGVFKWITHRREISKMFNRYRKY